MQASVYTKIEYQLQIVHFMQPVSWTAVQLAPTYSSAAHLLQFLQLVSICVVHGVALNCEVATLSVATRRDVEKHSSHSPQYGRWCIDT